MHIFIHHRRMSKLAAGLLILVLLLALAGVAFADSPGQILRSVIGSGGQRVQAGGLVLNGTVGESVVGGPVPVGAMRVASGFWQRIVTATKGYLPFIRK